MFKNFKKQVEEKFNQLAKNQTQLYRTDVTGENMWQAYLDSFSNEDAKQSHTCNCCKSFIRQYGNVVAIVDGKVCSMWDVTPNDEIYIPAAKNMTKLVLNAPIKDIFTNDFTNLGTDSNVATLEDGTSVTWNHFFVKLPPAFVNRTRLSNESVIGKARDSRNVLNRALEEIDLETTQTVIELIEQNSIYRGAEFLKSLQAFEILQKEYKDAKDKQLYSWTAFVIAGEAISRIRNSAIGTLLVNISEGMDLDKAVTAFEKVVAPANYKRPAAIVTSKQIEDANKAFENLGLKPSLKRRFATYQDIPVEEVMFVNRNAEKMKSDDLFENLKAETPVNPKTFSKVQEITLDDFLKNVVPSAKKVELFIDNTAVNQVMSLVAPEDPEAPKFLKWENNDISWSYVNGHTDSITKQLVKSAGGNVDGYMRVSLRWYNSDDLDIQIIEPDRNMINYSSKQSASTLGKLDVDMNAFSISKDPVENVIYPNNHRMKEGVYTVKVNNYRKRDTVNQGYVIETEYNGIITEYAEKRNPSEKSTHTVLTFSFSKKDGIKFLTGTPSEGKVNSEEKYGLKTNTFAPVTMIVNSPNYWGNNQYGNKHVFFLLPNAKNTEAVRGFYNEFLPDNLVKDNKRILEILGSKSIVAPSETQATGVGFSTTQETTIVVRVQSNFERILKIKL